MIQKPPPEVCRAKFHCLRCNCITEHHLDKEQGVLVCCKCFKITLFQKCP